jgi:hypothetical protein
VDAVLSARETSRISICIDARKPWFTTQLADSFIAWKVYRRMRILTEALMGFCNARF